MHMNSPLVGIALRRDHAPLGRHHPDRRAHGPEVGAVRQILRTLDGVQRPPGPEVTTEVLQFVIFKLPQQLQGGRLGAQLVLGVEGKVFAGNLPAVNVVSSSQDF